MACQVIVRRISTNSAAQTQSKSLNYCINLLQKRAYEQYIATLLLPPKIRRCGFAIRAFNIEISSIRDQVMRLKGKLFSQNLFFLYKIDFTKKITKN